MEISTGQVAFFLAGAFALVNVGSALAVWRDKRRAMRGQWRIQEGTLLGWALVGGWPGGIWAMLRFRHKTAKLSFAARYLLATVLNVTIVVAIIIAATA